MKLFYQIYGWLIVGIVLLIGFEGYLSFNNEIDQFDLDMQSDAVLIGHIMAGVVEQAWSAEGKEEAVALIANANQSDSRIKLRWIGSDQQAGQRLDPAANAAAGSPDLGDPRAFEDRKGFRYSFFPIGPQDHPWGVLEMGQSLAPLETFKHRMLSRSVSIACLLLLMSGVLLFFLFRQLIQAPLDQLMEKARRIGEGNLDSRLDIRATGELADLAGTMNTMCRRLQAAQNAACAEYQHRIAVMEQLRHAERLATLGRLAAGIAHELGTPLNVITGRAKFIARGDMTPEEITQSAGIIQDQGHRMTAIIRQLLNFARPSPPSRSREAIPPLIRRVTELLGQIAGKHGVSFTQKVREDIPAVMIDGAQIQQVLINIVMNGIQAMPEGGRIEFDIRTESICPPASQSRVKSLYLAIGVKDHGMGMSQDNLRHIFDPFFTTKSVGQGTGLGLSIAYGIVNEHQGWIEAASEPDRGSCFTIYLPVAVSP